LQLTQAPWQATLQQIPSVQNPKAHSLPAMQAAPGGFGPQLPRTQVIPGAQSPSVTHAPLQLLSVESQP
jgi:hypothetical protein